MITKRTIIISLAVNFLVQWGLYIPGTPVSETASAKIARHAILGLKGICLLPVNPYAPGDNFNLETSHVILALIHKFCYAVDTDAKKITVWGIGSVSRDFFHVKDAARTIAMGPEKYDESDIKRTTMSYRENKVVTSPFLYLKSSSEESQAKKILAQAEAKKQLDHLEGYRNAK